MWYNLDSKHASSLTCRLLHNEVYDVVHHGLCLGDNYLMENLSAKSENYYVIDIIQIAKALFRRLWILVIAGILAASVGFATSAFIITPKYSSSVRIYVNNSSISLGSASLSISSSEISAAQSLVRTYIVILKDQTTLEQVITRSGLNYSYEELSGMINAVAVDNTEILRVIVTCEDPYEASDIANNIADVLNTRISEIIKGTSMEVVGYAKPNLQKVSPSITRYTAVGFIIGALIAGVIIVLLELKDNTIHDEDYIVQLGDYPLLAKIPDLLNPTSGKYGYYTKYGYNSYGNASEGEDNYGV